MARRARYSNDTVAQINGYDIDREKIGAAVYWNAIKVEDGYVVRATRNCGSKAAAIAIAKADVGEALPS